MIYILTVVDSKTRYCSATPLNLKSDIYKILSNILNFESKRCNFINFTMQEYCKEHLIKCQTSDPYTLQQNGLAERHNRTIIESLRTILMDSKINRQYWSKIVKVSTLTLNQIPSHRSNKSPYELLRGRNLPLDFFHPIGNPVSFLNEPKSPSLKL
ncbi:hypothetical protein VP01_6175g1, partial [Puccinia sorghi]